MIDMLIKDCKTMIEYYEQLEQTEEHKQIIKDVKRMMLDLKKQKNSKDVKKMNVTNLKRVYTGGNIYIYGGTIGDYTFICSDILEGPILYKKELEFTLEKYIELYEQGLLIEFEEKNGIPENITSDISKEIEKAIDNWNDKENIEL